MAPPNTPHTGSPASQEPLQGLQKDALNLKEQGKEQFEHYRDNTAEQIENLAENAQTAARHMADNDTLGLSRYVSDLAQGMTSLAENLRGKNADELLQDAGKLARDNPLLFISGSVALGLGLSRVLKASMPTADPTPSTDASLTPPEPVPPSDLTAEAIATAPAHPHDLPGDGSLRKDLPQGGL